MPTLRPYPGFVPDPRQPRLHVTGSIEAQLEQAGATGATDASAWLQEHPKARAGQLQSWLKGSVPAPPTGVDAEAELAQVREIAGRASSERMQDARWFGWYGHADEGLRKKNIWNNQLAAYQRHVIRERGPIDGVQEAAHAAQLVQHSVALTNELVEDLKLTHPEHRPFTHDPRLADSKDAKSEGAVRSHPSGHAASAYAAATVLAGLWPQRAATTNATAERIAFSRVLTQMHYPHDVVLGARLGSAVGTAVLAGIKS